MSKPKNIVLIMADQLAAAHLGCYGSGVPSSPALDALAARGMRFDRCYATSPVCTPNRAAMFTGRSPVVNGMVSNNYTLQADSATYAHVLARHGYHVGGFGKFHQCPMPLPHPEGYAHLGFHESVISEDPKWGAWTEWIRREHPEYFETALAVAWGDAKMERPFPDPRYEREALSEIRGRILRPLCEASPWEKFYTSPLPAELHQTTWLTDLALDYMRRRASEAEGGPFFCCVSYVDPHDPYDPPKPYDTLFDPADMRPPIPAEWREEGNPVLERSRNWLGFSKVAGDEDIIRQLRAHYHGSIKLIDDQVARLIQFLDENGMWEDTVVLFTTDHGDAMGDHDCITKGVVPYDTGIRCPLIVAGADVEPGSADALISTLDFFPTFCDWAGVDASQRPPLEGRSFAGTCRGEGEGGPGSVLSAFGPTSSVLSDDGWRLTVFNHPAAPNQLVNLREDPDELHNRYTDPAAAHVRTRLMEAMIGHYTRIAEMPQYRNLPVINGEKYTPGGAGNGSLVDPIPQYGDAADTPVWQRG